MPDFIPHLRPENMMVSPAMREAAISKMVNEAKIKQAEASTFDDDVKRVRVRRPVSFSVTGPGGQSMLISLSPTVIYDDPHLIKIMDEAGIAYDVLSGLSKRKKG